MRKAFKTLWKPCQGEIVEKKSRFLAHIRPVETEEEVQTFLEEIRKTYWDARHHCFAYILGPDQSVMRLSDDGEPSQTAGKPMMDVLMGEGLYYVCAVVTRYFGGTLLGTGGLVRAYSQAVKAGLSNGTIIEKIPGEIWKLSCTYTDLGKIQYIAGQMDVKILSSQYTDQVELTVLLPEKQKDLFFAAVTDGVSGRARWRLEKELYFARLEKEALLFP